MNLDLLRRRLMQECTREAQDTVRRGLSAIERGMDVTGQLRVADARNYYEKAAVAHLARSIFDRRWDAAQDAALANIREMFKDAR